MNKLHNIQKLLFIEQTLKITVDGNEYPVDLQLASPRLASANDSQRNNYVISPSGYGSIGLIWMKIFLSMA
jgi:hypothetical protein